MLYGTQPQRYTTMHNKSNDNTKPFCLKNKTHQYNTHQHKPVQYTSVPCISIPNVSIPITSVPYDSMHFSTVQFLSLPCTSVHFASFQLHIHIHFSSIRFSSALLSPNVDGLVEKGEGEVVRRPCSSGSRSLLYGSDGRALWHPPVSLVYL